jgi:hypothetical protein
VLPASGGAAAVAAHLGDLTLLKGEDAAALPAAAAAAERQSGQTSAYRIMAWLVAPADLQQQNDEVAAAAAGGGGGTTGLLLRVLLLL